MLVPALVCRTPRMGRCRAATNVLGVARQRWAWAVAISAVMAAVGLLLPWAGSGTQSRSTIELLASASALDVLSGPQQILLIGAWLAIVVLAAAGLVAVAWHRVERAVPCFVALGPALVVTALVIRRSPLAVEWGAYVSSALGLVASVGSAALLAGGRGREGAIR